MTISISGRVTGLGMVALQSARLSSVHLQGCFGVTKRTKGLCVQMGSAAPRRRPRQRANRDAQLLMPPLRLTN